MRRRRFHEENIRGAGLLCVGPQRTASSWLDRVLRVHPNLTLPVNVKETFFFDRYYDRGVGWYLSHFGDVSGGSLLAEVGSTYFESAEAQERIRTANPEARILITIRNPIARSFSSFGHEYAKGRASGDFFEAVASQPRIVESGRYSVLAPEWEGAFGSEQVLYVVQEDIEADPQGQFDAICAFLGLAANPLPEELKGRYGQGTVPRFRWLAATASRTASVLRGAGLHRVVETGKRLGLKRVYGGGDRQALSVTRPIFEYLLAEHEADIRFLEERLGRDFSHWREPATYGLEAE
ncbi:sulfotransferase family protein [Thioalkalivibrio sp. ALE21]|uniref:sulfotransferase family protein n=1 Tax=Thioalkalivibrio sp. ALE21 TaxID=1158175 RepID=UPI000D94F5AC|nr:sulfotransferase [Thioalkalivibrio sp. ALE21]PYF99999.1 sulfotransferase family protein [Thioalkalivibrio sp. ALE21]